MCCNVRCGIGLDLGLILVVSRDDTIVFTFLLEHDSCLTASICTPLTEPFVNH